MSMAAKRIDNLVSVSYCRH